jgi:hypothetical protein
MRSITKESSIFWRRTSACEPQGQYWSWLAPWAAAPKPLARYHAIFQYLGGLDKREVVREMQNAHVRVLPSVFEGFGLMICGKFKNLQSNISNLRSEYE